MFRSQFDLAPETIKNLREFVIFIILVYPLILVYSSKCCNGPDNDLNLLKKIYEYRKINSQISSEVENVFGRHLWYLNPQLAALAFFDDQVSVNDTYKMVKNLNIKNCNAGTGNEKRMCYSTDILKKKLPGFITSDSKKLFTAWRGFGAIF